VAARKVGKSKKFDVIIASQGQLSLLVAAGKLKGKRKQRELRPIVEKTVSTINPTTLPAQDLVQLVCAFARLHDVLQTPKEAAMRLLEPFIQGDKELSPAQIATILPALVDLELCDTRFICFSSNQFLKNLKLATASEISDVLYGFAKLRPRTGIIEFVKASQIEYGRRLEKQTSSSGLIRGLPRVLWASARLHVKIEQKLLQIAETIKPRQLGVAGLADLLWVLAERGESPSPVFLRRATSFAAERVADFEPQSLSKMIFASSALSHFDANFLCKAIENIITRIELYEPTHCLPNVLWGLMKAKGCFEDLQGLENLFAKSTELLQQYGISSLPVSIISSLLFSYVQVLQIENTKFLEDLIITGQHNALAFTSPTAVNTYLYSVGLLFSSLKNPDLVDPMVITELAERFWMDFEAPQQQMMCLNGVFPLLSRLAADSDAYSTWTQRINWFLSKYERSSSPSGEGRFNIDALSPAHFGTHLTGPLLERLTICCGIPRVRLQKLLTYFPSCSRGSTFRLTQQNIQSVLSVETPLLSYTRAFGYLDSDQEMLRQQIWKTLSSNSLYPGSDRYNEDRTHSRVGHSETHAIGDLLLQLKALGCKEDTSGKVELVVQHHPCSSCIKVIANDFRRFYPKIHLSIAYPAFPTNAF